MRQLGASCSPFARVVTTVLPRTRETANAMSCAVDTELPLLSSDPALYGESVASRWWKLRRLTREALYEFMKILIVIWRSLSHSKQPNPLFAITDRVDKAPTI